MFAKGYLDLWASFSREYCFGGTPLFALGGNTYFCVTDSWVEWGSTISSASSSRSIVSTSSSVVISCSPWLGVIDEEDSRLVSEVWELLTCDPRLGGSWIALYEGSLNLVVVQGDLSRVLWSSSVEGGTYFSQLTVSSYSLSPLNTVLGIVEIFCFKKVTLHGGDYHVLFQTITSISFLVHTIANKHTLLCTRAKFSSIDFWYVCKNRTPKDSWLKGESVGEF